VAKYGTNSSVKKKNPKNCLSNSYASGKGEKSPIEAGRKGWDTISP